VTLSTQQVVFMKNLAIIGGLIYMLVYGHGTCPKVRDRCREDTNSSTPK